MLNEWRMISPGLQIVPKGPDSFILSVSDQTEYSIEVSSMALRVLSCFSRARSIADAYSNVDEILEEDEFVECVMTLTEDGLLIRPGKPSIINGQGEDRVEQTISLTQCTWRLGVGVEVLHGRERIGLLRVEDQRLRILSGSLARIVGALPAAADVGLTPEAMLGANAQNEDGALSVAQNALAELALQGFVCQQARDDR